MQEFSFGANHSEQDPRTYRHEELTLLGSPLTTGGITYLPEHIEHQHTVGICTAISMVQLRERATGKKYSPDFQYLLQKKFYDKNWDEGSAIFYACKVAKNYGFLPIELSPITEADRQGGYQQYINKLKLITDEEVNRLIGLCVDKIPAYASVNVSDPQSIAKAIIESEAGILCRYDVDENWYSPSWLPKDIDPIKKPDIATSGHAIIASSFDYTNDTRFVQPNTWGTNWCNEGQCHIVWDNYKMTEAWTILKQAPEVSTKPTEACKLGDRSQAVATLQAWLISKGYSIPAGVTSFFGAQTRSALGKFQRDNGIFVINSGTVCGGRTLQAISRYL